MNIFKARGGVRNGWWTLEMVHFEIVAEGDTEAAMLADLSHQLKAHYAIARQFNLVPFQNLLTGAPVDDSEWNSGPRILRRLDIPTEVSEAMAYALHMATPKGTGPVETNIAIAA